MDFSENIKDLLNARVALYENVDFIKTDPIQIPKKFTKKEDIEIAGFIAATLAWGQRPQIIKKATLWMEFMENKPYDFILNEDMDTAAFANFVYRTFNSDDALFFLEALRNIYINHGGLENVFSVYPNDIKKSISYFREVFLEVPHLYRSEKHLANTNKGSAAKRINMFLRWMVREPSKGVDFGIWNTILPANLKIPLDTHSGNVARKLKLLHRKQNDWKAVNELTNRLLLFDSADPVKYDFALFGMGVFEKIR